MIKFKELSLGDVFDFIDDDTYFNSFFLPCKKVTTRKYVDVTGTIHRVGSVNAEVYHVNSAENKEVFL